MVIQQVSTNHIKWQALGYHMSNSGTGQTIVFNSVSTRCSAQAALSEGRLALHPSDLPWWSVAQPQTSRNYIVPPNHEAPATIRVFVAADRLIVVDGDAEGSLCIPAPPYREEGSGTDFREIAGQGERPFYTTRREPTGFLSESVNCSIVT